MIDDKADMDGIGVQLAVGAFKAIALVYDILTFPVYLILQQPWRTRQLSRRPKAFIVATKSDADIKNTDVSLDIGTDKHKNHKAVKVSETTRSITWRSLDEPQRIHVEIVRENITTMANMLEYVAKKYANKRCLGTREIKGEEDEVQPNGRVFKKYVMGNYNWKTYSEVNTLATHFGKGLRELGNLPKQNVVIFAETRAEWMIAAHGLFKQNIPVVTIYATLGDEAIAHGINETEVTTVITSYDLMPKFKKILDLTPKVKTLIYMEDQLKNLTILSTRKRTDIQVVKYQDVIDLGSKSKFDNSMPAPDDVSIIMYTSGSTGVPKGVIIGHTNLIATIKAFCDNTYIYDDDCLIGFLPLAHVFELLVESVCLCAGVSIGYSSALTMVDSSSKIKKGTKGDASVLCPTVMTGVPLILDRISKNIQEKVSKGSSFAKVLFKFAYEYKQQWKRRGYTTPLIDKIVFSKVTSLLGGRMRLILSGGAPLSPDTHEQIQLCLCLKVIQGYGLTESTSCATIMDHDDMVFGRVGHATTACDIRLVNWEEGNYRVTDKPYPRGEVLIGGENISCGYYKLPEKSKEDFVEEDGKRWFKTGDIAEVHADGVVKVIDRKKDLVKLQAGEYVSLGKVEAELKTCPFVDNICVYGDSNKQYCVALVVPNQSMLNDLAQKKGISGDFEELCSKPEIEKALQQEIAEHGKKCKLDKIEIPGAVKLVKEVWSPDMGLVTAAFKLKRKDIQARYQNEINRMYAS
ncbi:LOW QUALITY PROTEIN: long-chain-fatty-acid--CoA ligase 4-like [Atheta coriaria]|uniref:LOW QUALITY PROTEIN: long-chain-fatty-acid--CoA ligase 4-like n=1 Tax=Dalotia coriaria TaxID=877792 RepID=UPI0031F391CE